MVSDFRLSTPPTMHCSDGLPAVRSSAAGIRERTVRSTRPAEAVAGPFGGCQGVRFNNSPRPEVSASFPPWLRRTRREEALTLPWV